MPRVLQRQLHFPGRLLLAFLVLLVLLLVFSSVAAAQPFGAWGVWNGVPGKYVDIPHSADLSSGSSRRTPGR
jgi:hypothetical protein